MQKSPCEIGRIIDFVELLIVKALVDALLSAITVVKWGGARSTLIPALFPLVEGLFFLTQVGSTSRRKGW